MFFPGPSALPQTHTAHSHTDCHSGAWITSLGDHPAQIKKPTVLSLFTVMFCKQNLRKLTLSLGLVAMREALGIIVLNLSSAIAYWVPANSKGCTYSRLQSSVELLD